MKKIVPAGLKVVKKGSKLSLVPKTGAAKKPAAKKATAPKKARPAKKASSAKKAAATKKAEEPKAEQPEATGAAPKGLPKDYADLTVAQIAEAAPGWRRPNVEAALEHEKANANRKGAIAALEAALADKETH
jgi:DNA-binding protein HU-beta